MLFGDSMNKKEASWRVEPGDAVGLAIRIPIYQLIVVVMSGVFGMTGQEQSHSNLAPGRTRNSRLM